MTNPGDMLFALLRLSLNIDKNSTENCLPIFINVKNEYWEQLFKLSVRQGVLLLSYGGLQYLPSASQPPRKLKLRWCVNVVKGSERYDHYISVITKLSNLFLDKNISLLLIKGITISELYPVPYFRESGDIDICLLAEAERMNNLILSLGLKKGKRIPKHSTFILEGITVENHHTFFDTALQFQRESQLYKKMENILRSMFSEDTCLPINRGNIYQLPPQAAAIYFIGHTFRHFCCLDINIRQMCDWTIFFSKHKDNIDSELLSYQIIKLGLDKFVCHINSFCSNHLGFKPYFIIPSKSETKGERFILKTIMQYRVNPHIYIPVFDVLRYLFCRNSIYKRYLGEVSITEFLLPEIKSYLIYLVKERWRPANKKLKA